MNQSFFEDLVTSPAFANLPKLNQKFILDTMLGPRPTETVSTWGDVASKGVALKVVSMEALAPMPIVPRSPKLNPIHLQETQKPNKDNQKKLVPVCESPKKHSATQKKNKGKQPEKVVDLEAEEGQGIEDIDTEGVEPLTKFPDYIPPCKGKEKVTKDPDLNKFVISTPLLLEQVPFEGLCLARIPLLKMEY